jgi:hypothetical protein
MKGIKRNKGDAGKEISVRKGLREGEIEGDKTDTI